MRRAALAAIAAAALLAAAPASAQSGPEPGQAVLPADCEPWTRETVAAACDPSARLRASISFPGAPVATVDAEEVDVATAQVSDGREPLLPGERLTLSVTAPSPTARLLVKAAALPPEGERTIVLDRLVDGMTVAVSDSLEVTVTRGPEVVVLGPSVSAAAPPPPPALAPEELAARVVHGINAFFATNNVGFQEVCNALDPAVHPYFDLAFGDPEQYGCLSLMYLFTVGDENVPHAFASSAKVVSVRATRPGEALLTADLVYRYRPNSTGDRRRIALRARALLRRVGDGSWRLANPLPLLGLAATEGPSVTAPSLAKLRGRAANLRAEARRSRRRAAALERSRLAASHPLGGPASCARGIESRATDAPGDAVVNGSPERTRLPALGATVDLAGVTLVTRRNGPPCLVMDFVQPVDLTKPLDVELGAVTSDNRSSNSATVHIEAGRVFADNGDSDDVRFLRGARAAARGNRLVVRLAPGQWTGPVKRTSFIWTASAARPHPYAITIEDAARRTRHRPGS